MTAKTKIVVFYSLIHINKCIQIIVSDRVTILVNHMVWNHPEQFEDCNDKSLDMDSHNGSETESLSTPGLNGNDTGP